MSRKRPQPSLMSDGASIMRHSKCQVISPDSLADIIGGMTLSAGSGGGNVMAHDETHSGTSHPKLSTMVYGGDGKAWCAMNWTRPLTHKQEDEQRILRAEMAALERSTSSAMNEDMGHTIN